VETIGISLAKLKVKVKVETIGCKMVGRKTLLGGIGSTKIITVLNIDKGNINQITLPYDHMTNQSMQSNLYYTMKPNNLRHEHTQKSLIFQLVSIGMIVYFEVFSQTKDVSLFLFLNNISFKAKNPRQPILFLNNISFKEKNPCI